MKIRLTLMALALSLTVACAGKKVDSGADLAADAKAVLVVTSDDGRYVDGGSGARQIHYYSAQANKTWIVDDESRKTLRTFAGKDVPEVAIVENAWGGCATDACGCESACAACGCGSECGTAACGCGACSGNAEACGCGAAACGCGDTSACGSGCGCGCATPGR